MPLGEKLNFMQNKVEPKLESAKYPTWRQTECCVVHEIYNLTLINMDAVSSNASTT